MEDSTEYLVPVNNDLTTFVHVSNYIHFEYFVGYEVAALLGYKNSRDVIIKSVSKCNQLHFKDYPGAIY